MRRPDRATPARQIRTVLPYRPPQTWRRYARATSRVFVIACLHHLTRLTECAQSTLERIAVRAASRLRKHRPRQLTEGLLLTLRRGDLLGEVLHELLNLLELGRDDLKKLLDLLMLQQFDLLQLLQLVWHELQRLQKLVNRLGRLSLKRREAADTLTAIGQSPHACLHSHESSLLLRAMPLSRYRRAVAACLLAVRALGAQRRTT